MVRKRIDAVLISLALLIPCFWHSRIQAGDLSSHLYNAWLGTEILAGRGGGLELVSLRTNVLFDWVLLHLTQWGGSGLAEHVAVPAAVLILFWGAVAWIRSATGSSGRALMPGLAMLAYGWVFHIGLFNFYISIGLSFWVLALLWSPRPARVLVAVPVLGLAFLAHLLPVLWCCGTLGYIWTVRLLPEKWRPWAPLPAMVLVVAGRMLLGLFVKTSSAPYAVMEIWGLDQVWVFGAKYALTALLLGVWAGIQLVRVFRSQSVTLLLENLPVQLSAVMVVVILVAPWQLEPASVKMPLTFITERMTLPLAVLFCVVLSQLPAAVWQTWALTGVTVLQFSFLYADTGALNWWEDRVVEALSTVPPGARVVGSIHDSSTRGLLWNHGLDRPCIGRFYSFQNYEPASLAFQVVAWKPNGLVMQETRDTRAAERGKYVAKPGDLPLYQVVGCASGRLCAQPMVAGEKMRLLEFKMLPAFW